MNHPKRILIIDDSEFDRKLLEKVLVKKGFTCTYCESGENALISIKMDKPDVVLLDIMMPGISGIETLINIRQQFSSIQLPIIMVTSKTDDAAIIDALQKGANDYITKPVHYDIAVMRINTQIDVVENSRKLVAIKELKAINALITTYNHEINNPLAIAVSAIKLFELTKEPKLLKKINYSLWRIADIVKLIDEAAQKTKVDYEAYTDKTDMVKIKKD